MARDGRIVFVYSQMLDGRTFILTREQIRDDRNPQGRSWAIEVEVIVDNTNCHHDELPEEKVEEIRKEKGMSNYMPSIYDIDPDWECDQCPQVVDVTRWQWRNHAWVNTKEIYSGNSLIADGVVNRYLFDKKIEPILVEAGLDPSDYV